MTELAIACMVRAALLARACGAPDGVGLVVRRRAVFGVMTPSEPWDPPCTLRGHGVARHVVEWRDDDMRCGLVIADVSFPLA